MYNFIFIMIDHHRFYWLAAGACWWCMELDQTGPEIRLSEIMTLIIKYKVPYFVLVIYTVPP
jgi:hypothetical protein